MRRNMLIAQTLARSPVPTAGLLIAGAKEASAFSMPPGVDCLTLPSLQKEPQGNYLSRFLGIPLSELSELRAKTIQAAVEAFRPDVLIVDKVPRGAAGELDLTLESIRREGKTRCILGLREVLDDPATVEREWREADNDRVIRDYYDAVWVYGDPKIFDPVQEYDLGPAVAQKVRYTGYLDQRERLESTEGAAAEMKPLEGRRVVCMVGGGQDGARLATVFLEAEFPTDTQAVLLCGPFMPRKTRHRLQRRAARNPQLRVIDFVNHPEPILARADRVIAMGGYNTVCEILSFEKRALIVPRVRPRREQLIRAERLRDLNLIDMLHPDDLSPAALSQWLASTPGPCAPIRDRVDLGGLSRLLPLLEEVIEGPAQAKHGPHFQRGTQHVES